MAVYLILLYLTQEDNLYRDYISALNAVSSYLDDN